MMLFRQLYSRLPSRHRKASTNPSLSWLGSDGNGVRLDFFIPSSFCRGGTRGLGGGLLAALRGLLLGDGMQRGYSSSMSNVFSSSFPSLRSVIFFAVLLPM